MARSLACAGTLPGDILHNAYGYGLFTGGRGAHYGAERLGCSVVPVSGGGTERQVVLLQDFGARVLCATPSYALNIAEVAARQGVDLCELPVSIGVFGAEPWSDAMRDELEDKLGLKAVDIYGLSEILGPGVAMECHVAQDGLHAWEDHFLFETIDPETLEPVPEGQPGELVITTLTKEALPMVRYRTHDDMLMIRGVNVYPSQVESVLVGLVNNLLDMEKIEAAKYDYSMAPMSIAELVTEAVVSNAPFATLFDVSFEISDELPDLTVEADYQRLHLVMTNLLSNAAKHSHKGGRVAVSARRIGGSAKILVQDWGSGIPEDFLDKVFDKFSVAGSSGAETVLSTGLGLAICRAIIDRHEGTIGVASKEGVGSTFYFELPLHTEDA